MSRQLLLPGVLLAVVSIVATGCRPQQPGYLFEDGDLSHYVGVATQIEYPDVQPCSLDEVKGALPPLTLENSKPREIWDLTLEEAMRIALNNGNVIRSLGGVAFGVGGTQGEPSALLRGPDTAMTTYDVARTESDARFGTEAALSAFDAQFATTMNWEHGVTLQNSALASSPPILVEDQATFQSQLSKTNATGGTVSLAHNVSYLRSNVPSIYKLYPSAYTANLQMTARQPLLQGFGPAFNRIAGPGAIPGFNNGVMIARLRTDVSQCDFEAAVRGLVSDVEKAYWETYYAYRRLDSVIAGRDSALQTWRQVNAKYVMGGRGGGAQEEAQARQQYFTFRGAVENALSNLYSTENNLRYMMGLAVTDGRLIRPADEPTTARVSFDWYDSHGEAMTRSVELRRQKWRIKERELEIISAKNYLLPRLDAVGQYTWNGLGHVLLDKDNSEPNAYGSLTSGEAPGWLMGFEFRMPLGFRKEMAGVRNAQLNLARERAVLQEQELELSHQLALAFRQLSDRYVLSETHYNRRIAAQKEVEAVWAAYSNGTATLDLLLSAQQRKAEAEVEYYRALVDYSLAISDIHFRKGSLLEYNGVCLAEGPWPGKAYFDAVRRARARDASVYLDYGFTRPEVISRGPIVQHAGTAAQMPADAESTAPETIPAPAPEPADQLTPPSEPQNQRGSQSSTPAGPALNAAAANYTRPAGARPAGARPAGRWQPKYDLGNMNLRELSASQGASPAAHVAPAAGSVQPTAYQEPAPAPASRSSDIGNSNARVSITFGKSSTSAKPANDGWKGANRSEPSNERVADLPSAPTHPSSSGWKRVQR